MGSRLHVCLTLAVVSDFNQGLCLPAVAGGAQNCLFSRFISGVPFSEKMIFTIIKEKCIVGLEIFPDQSGPT